MLATQVGRSLGWASLLIGLTEIVAPRKLEQAMGIGNGRHTGVLRVLGIREILSGVDILWHRDPEPGVQARVAGDIIDLAMLGAAALKSRRPSGLLSIAAAVLGIGVLDMICSKQLSRRGMFER
ncbi:MAG TPA: hypothetical protein VH370_23445 [Humisphaera sp.]|jgi:hypothetical protein|nr:hypothetical protein [Humisphaera sp.]